MIMKHFNIDVQKPMNHDPKTGTFSKFEIMIMESATLPVGLSSFATSTSMFRAHVAAMRTDFEAGEKRKVCLPVHDVGSGF